MLFKNLLYYLKSRVTLSLIRITQIIRERLTLGLHGLAASMTNYQMTNDEVMTNAPMSDSIFACLPVGRGFVIRHCLNLCNPLLGTKDPNGNLCNQLIYFREPGLTTGMFDLHRGQVSGGKVLICNLAK